MDIFEEGLMEPVARYFRFLNTFKKIVNNKPIIIADIGCGPQIRAYFAMKKRSLNISKYIGIDPLISKKILKAYSESASVILIPELISKRIPLPDRSVDYIISLATLEHIDNPKHILLDMPRVLKKGGSAIITSPTPRAKQILEFMSFKLGLISKREIKEHKNYFTKELLYSMICSTKKISITHKYFELGLNNLLIIKKIT